MRIYPSPPKATRIGVQGAGGLSCVLVNESAEADTKSVHFIGWPVAFGVIDRNLTTQAEVDARALDLLREQCFGRMVEEN